METILAWVVAVFTVSGMWVWFWALVCFGGILTFAEREENFFAFIALGLYAVVINLSTEFKFLDNIWTVVFWLAVYYAIGAFWSVGKWFSFINQQADKFGEIKVNWIRQKHKGIYDATPSAVLAEPHQAEFFDYVKRSREYCVKADANADSDNIEYFHPAANRYKERLLTWVLWWPTSAFWTFLNDPLVRFGKWIVSRFNGVYSRIVTRAYAKFG